MVDVVNGWVFCVEFICKFMIFELEWIEVLGYFIFKFLIKWNIIMNDFVDEIVVIYDEFVVIMNVLIG